MPPLHTRTLYAYDRPMDSVRHLIVGAGVSGLATAAALTDPDYLVLEADREIGGYCKTIVRDGFVWDYSAISWRDLPPLQSRLRGLKGRRFQSASKAAAISWTSSGFVVTIA